MIEPCTVRYFLNSTRQFFLILNLTRSISLTSILPSRMLNAVEVAFYINQLINVIFVIDMVLVFLMPFEGPDGCWVTSRPALAKSYFCRMFVVDAISVVPFDVIAATQRSSDIGDLKVLRMLKLLRLLKKLRIFRGLRIMKRYETDCIVDYQALNISMLMVCLLISAHWIACLLALICRYDLRSPSLADFLPDMFPPEEKPSTIKSYFYCFNWGLSWITTGEGGGHDESLISTTIRFYISMLLILGAIANAAIIGGVMTVVDEMNVRSREFYGDLNTLNAYLRNENVPNRMMSWRSEMIPGKEFCRRLRTFYLFKYSNVQRYYRLGDILENLSGDMRCVVADAMYGDVLRGCTIFANASANLVAAIAVEMRVDVHAQGDLVYERHDPANDLYFTLKGTIMLPGKSINVYRKGGQPFGLEVIYKMGAPRGRAAISVTESVLLAVDGDVVRGAIDKFAEPSIRWRVLVTSNLVAVARALHEAVRETLREGGCDVASGVRHLDDQLASDNVLFQVDPRGMKHNNLLAHFERLTRQKLVASGMSTKRIKELLGAFMPFWDRYDEGVAKVILQHRRDLQLQNLLEKTENDAGLAMDKWFHILKKEKVETIETLKRLQVTDMRLIGIPLGDAVVIVDGAKRANTFQDMATSMLHTGDRPLVHAARHARRERRLGGMLREGIETNSAKKLRIKTAEEKSMCSASLWNNIS